MAIINESTANKFFTRTTIIHDDSQAVKQLKVGEAYFVDEHDCGSKNGDYCRVRARLIAIAKYHFGSGNTRTTHKPHSHFVLQRIK